MFVHSERSTDLENILFLLFSPSTWMDNFFLQSPPKALCSCKSDSHRIVPAVVGEQYQEHCALEIVFIVYKSCLSLCISPASWNSLCTVLDCVVRSLTSIIPAISCSIFLESNGWMDSQAYSQVQTNIARKTKTQWCSVKILSLRLQKGSCFQHCSPERHG